MTAFVGTAARGLLCKEHWNWLLDSSLTFLRKSGPAPAPRPIRVGEVLRRVVAKRLAAAGREEISALFARARQLGVACPAGAEALVHHRVAARSFAARSPADVADVGVWDVDWRNCYGSLLWADVDECVESDLPEALAWTRWCHRCPVRVRLPSGDPHWVDRGVEQGDPLGPVYAAAVLRRVAARARLMAARAAAAFERRHPSTDDVLAGVGGMWRGAVAEWQPCSRLAEEGLAAFDRLLRERTAEQLAAAVHWDAAAGRGELTTSCPSPAVPGMAGRTPRCLDSWYLDDAWLWGQAVHGDLFLAALDVAGCVSGMERNGAKCSFAFAAARAGTPPPPYTRLTCTVVAGDAPPRALGVALAGAAQQFGEKVRAVGVLHASIAELEDPGVELALTRGCAAVSKVMYLLRALGPQLDSDAGRGLPDDVLSSYDDLVDAAVSRIAGEDLSGEATEQASLGVRLGGLGLRRATATALPAHAASLIDAAPWVQWLDAQAAAFGAPTAPRDALGPHVERLNVVWAALTDDLSAGAVATCVAAREAAHARASGVVAVAAGDVPRAARRVTADPGMLVDDAGLADAEHPAVWRGAAAAVAGGGKGAASSALQRALLRAVDGEAAHVMFARAQADTSELGRLRARRLADLSDRRVDHGWLWAINPGHGWVLAPREYVTGLRLRLGARCGPDFAGRLPCRACGHLVSADAADAHALGCDAAAADRTRRHNEVRDHLLPLVAACDPRARVEQTLPSAGIDGEGLLRPADVLTSAAPLPGCGAGLCALDVGVTGPFTAAALASTGHDPVVSYERRKVKQYKELCARDGWTYVPLVFSAFGRCGDGTSAVIDRFARIAARRFGLVDAGRVAASWRRNLGVILVRWSAAMVARCRPAGAAWAPTVHRTVAGGVDEDALGMALGGTMATAAATVGAAGLVGGAFDTIGRASDPDG